MIAELIGEPGTAGRFSVWLSTRLLRVCVCVCAQLGNARPHRRLVTKPEATRAQELSLSWEFTTHCARWSTTEARAVTAESPLMGERRQRLLAKKYPARRHSC